MATSCSVNISGTASGATCVSYSNCPTNCCTPAYTGCGGTVGYNCDQWSTKPTCEAHPTCCTWSDSSGRCIKRLCFTLSEADCATCTCTQAGTCTKIACASLTGTSKNPDVCPGCDTCGATWNVDSVRTLPWAVYVTTRVAFASGQIALNTYRLTTPSIIGPGSLLGPGEVYA